MRILVISVETFDKWNEKNRKNLVIDELTDEQFENINEQYEYGWGFDSLEEYVSAFNRDDNSCPVPSSHYIRVIS